MCTNFKMKQAKDGSIVVGRSLEFPTLMPTALSVLPKDYAGAGQAPDGGTGKTWTASHGVVGMCAFGKPEWLLDGMNDAGVSAHLLYMPGGYCTYQPFAGKGEDLSQVDMVAYLLGTCTSIAEVKKAMDGVNIWGVDPGMGFPPPIHCLVHASDGSIAIEFHAHGWVIVDNPTGVGTNAPYMDWHLTNLGSYVAMTNDNPGAVEVDGMSLAPLGQGTGLLGLPGDYSPPGRFVRAAAMVHLADQPADGDEAEQFTAHILNAFDMVPGLVKESFGKAGTVDEVTVWDSICNLTQGRFAYRTVTNPQWYVVELGSTDFTKPARTQDLNWKGSFTAIAV